MKSYKSYVGPRTRRRRRRRWGKLGVVTGVLTWLLFTLSLKSSPTGPQEAPKPTISPSELQYCINVSKLSPGHARAFAEQYPDHAEDFPTAAGITD